MTADMALTLSGLLLEFILLALLLGRRIHRSLPTFVGYVAVALATDLLASLVPTLIARDLFLRFWIASLLLEFACCLGVIVELGRNLLRQNRTALPNWFLASALFIPAVWVLTLLSRWTIPPRLPLIWQIDLRLSQVTAIVSLGAFLALAWWSALRRLRWPPREFRIGAGIGLEALVALVAAIIHTHQPAGPAYHWVDVSASVVYLAVLIYWVQYFVFYDQAELDLRGRDVEFASAGRSDDADGAGRMYAATPPGSRSR